MGGNHYPPLSFPDIRGALAVTDQVDANCGAYPSLTSGCTSVWQSATAGNRAVETGIQYNTTHIGVRREVVFAPAVEFTRSPQNIFTGTATAQNHIIASNNNLVFAGVSKIAKRGNARFKLDVVSQGEWELNFNVYRRGSLSRTMGILNEARIAAWLPNIVTSSGITNVTHNLAGKSLPAQGSASTLVDLASQTINVDQSLTGLQIKGKGSGTILLNADFDMFVDAGDLGAMAALPGSACWLGGSQLNHLNPQAGMAGYDYSSLYQPLCKSNTTHNEAQGLTIELVSFLADYDDDGIKDNVDNCNNVKNTSQTDLNNDGMGDACDLLAPSAPTNLVVNAAGNIVTGNAQPESTVNIYFPTGTLIGTAVVAANGTFSASISPAQLNGQSLRVTATDSGGTSPNAFVTAPDTIPPAAPTNVAINATGTVVTGQAQVGSIVEVKNPAGTIIGSQTVPASGNFSITLNPAQTDGQILPVTARDNGGTSPAVNVTAPDLGPPAAPTNLAVNTSGTVVTGKAEPGSTIEVKGPNGLVIGTGTANGSGDFSVAISPAQVNGQLLSVTAEDAGGKSVPSTVLAPDTIAPSAPLNAAINATGTIVTGQAQIGSTVEVKNPAGTIIGSQVVPASGNFSITLNPAQTDGQILAVTAKDLGGTSPVVYVTAPDLAAPAAPTNLAVNATGTVVTGKAEADSTVEVKDPSGTVIGTGIANSNGDFSVAISPAQTDGELLSVTAADGGGQSAPATVNAPDLAPPASPTQLAVNATGTVVTGKAEAGSTIEVKDPAGAVIGTGTANSSGDFSVTISPAQTGAQVLSVTATDGGGTSAPAAVTAPDLSAPDAPTNLVVNSTGTRITGDAQAGSLVIIKDPSGLTIGSGQADANGKFDLALAPAQVNGELLSVTATDNAGTSLPATVLAPDTIAPASPLQVTINGQGTIVSGKAQPGSTVEVKDPAGALIGTVTVPVDGNFDVTLNPAQTNGEVLAVTAKDLGGTSPVVNVTAPDLTPPNAPQNPVVNAAGTAVSGTAQPGSTIEVKDPAGNPIGSGQADNNGNFMVVISPAQTNGEVLKVTATDAGGTSPPSDAQAPDSTPPAAPQSAVVNATGTQVSGKAQPGSTVEVKDPAGTPIGSATADVNGDYIVPINPAQTNGQVLKVTATDTGGTSPAIDAQAPDLIPPAAPQTAVVNATGTQVSGQAQPGSTVEVKDPAGTPIGSATADANGDYIVPINPAQTNGQVLKVTATDAGGTSPAIDAQAPDLTPPNAPQTAVVNADGTEVSGKAQPGSTVEVKDPAGTSIGSTTADANGDYIVQINPAQTNGEVLKVTATDAGGISPAIDAQAPDLTPPDAPQNPVVNATGTAVSGKAQPGSSIEVKDPAGTPIGSGVTDANGDFTVAINPAQIDGEVLTVTATDAGGTSAPANAQAPDTTAPDSPTGLIVAPDGSSVSGKAEPGSTIEVKDPAGNPIGSGTADANGDFTVPLNPAQTNGEVLTVAATDAGGTSPPVDAQAPDLTAPNAPTEVVVSPDGTQATGKAQPGSTVEVKDPAGNPLGSTTAGADGSFTVPLTPAQTNGEVLQVTATDAGGTSPPVDAQAPDLTAPNAPTDVVVSPDGTQVTGKAQPGSTVEVKDPAGNPIGSTTAGADGSFTVLLTPAQTNGQILKVTATDAGGTSNPTDAQAPDLPLPAAPTDLAVGANGASVTGKAEAGSTVTIKDPSGAVIGTATADASGNFYAVISPAQVMGQVLTVTAANANGVSPAANVTAPNLDEEFEAGVLMRAWGEFVKDKFGHAIAAGDIDGDGHVDVVVGAPHYSRVIAGTTKKIKKVGRVYAYSGRTGRLMLTLDGEMKGDWFGHSVAVLDFDGDGQLDIAVGAPRAKSSPALKNSGKVYVYSGADGSLLATALGSAKGEQLGATMVSLSHDSDSDLLAVSAPKAKSAAGLPRAGYVSVLGFDGATSSKAKQAYRIDGEVRQDQLGTVLALAPDLTGDGYAELAVGLPKANSLSASGKFGLVRVYSTETTSANSRLLATIDGAQLPATAGGAPRKGDLFGASVATVDDMDGDGINELLIGAPGFDPIKGGKRINNAGAAFVASSSMLQTGTTQANWLTSYYGEAKKDQFGWAVANGGALQAGGDIYHFIAAKGVDVIIANPKNGKPMKANDAGALYGYKAGAAERSFKRTGSAKKGYYGNVLLAVGDVDKDGYTDVITASPFMSRYTPITRKWWKNMGFVEVYSGEFIVNRPTP